MNTNYSGQRRILDPAGLADMLRISERHLLDLRQEEPTFPTPRMLGRNLPRWDSDAIFAWVANVDDDTVTADSSDEIAPVSTTKSKRTRRAKDDLDV